MDYTYPNCPHCEVIVEQYPTVSKDKAHESHTSIEDKVNKMSLNQLINEFYQ